MSASRIRIGGRRSLFDRFAGQATRLAGTSWAFIAATLIVMLWAATGPLFGYSENWQIVINTGTTIVTFLMVFLIQQSQNKDSAAIHIKLNELLACNELASNRLVAAEELDEAELHMLARFYTQLARQAARDGGLKCSHSLDDANALHEHKQTVQTGARHSHRR